MVYRPDAGADGVLDAVVRLGVCHHPAAEAAGRLDQDVQLLLGEVGVAGIVPWREDSSRGRHLDDVCPHADQLPHLLPHLFDAVDDVAGYSGMGNEDPDVLARRHPTVTVAAGLADHRQRDLHVRPGDEAGLHRRLHAQVGGAGVADRGDPGGQRVAQVPLRRVEGA